MQTIFDKILDEIKKANDSLISITFIENEMREFLGQNNTKPEDIKRLAEEVSNKSVTHQNCFVNQFELESVQYVSF